MPKGSERGRLTPWEGGTYAPAQMRSGTHGFVVALLLAFAGTARAEEGDLELFAEPISYTDVVDAFDGNDPFDLAIRVGFARSLTVGNIQRETYEPSSAASSPGDGRGTANFVGIAAFERVRHTLVVGADIGLFHDLAFYARMPLVLSDSRQLRVPDGRTASEVNADLAVTNPNPPNSEEQLFQVPFTSPERSGIESISAGLAWAIFNQFRQPALPTWVIMAEGQFSLGDAMVACFDEAPSASIERCNGGTDPGISEGTNGLRVETRASRRYRYVEPYGGLAFQIAWPGSSESLYAPSGELDGFMNTLPPRLGTFTAGLAAIPWEHPGRFQRFSIDLRATGTYVSEGHGYSPLFDALGTSQSYYLTEPVPEAEPTEGVDPRKVEFFGLTDMQAHGVLAGRLALEMQAAKYVQFGFGAQVSYATPYMLTYADACNPSITDNDRKGTCREGIINPHHRPAIDLPGRRFRMQGELGIDLFAHAAAQF